MVTEKDRQKIIEKLRRQYREYGKINTAKMSKWDIVVRLDFAMLNISLLLDFESKP